MAADLDAPSAPFVIITRKGGFPAATLAEAQRLIRPLLTDPKACVTDAKGRKYTPRDFLAGCDRATQPVVPMSKDIKDWAAATADIDLDTAPPPGWTPPAAPAPGIEAGNPARSSARLRAPASTRSSANMPAARRTPTSDRRQVSDRRGRDDGGGGIPPLVIVLIIAVIVMGGVILAVIGNRSSRNAMNAPPPSTAPTPAPVQPTPPSPTRPDGTVRPEDRPLPTYMQ